ncbi:hypothetical protein LCGC14_0855570 [marine sediment metagenome]|uniref:Uncharacterized protein n=1 Tax=marine sediment metagenome TaxID=412755 RepID=A0A0F9RTM2_9ZZZZ
MKLVMRCTVVDGGHKEQMTVPLEYKSKKKCLYDFMKLAKAIYKNRGTMYDRGGYFMFMGLRFASHDYYHEFSDCMFSPGRCPPLESPPTIYTLEEWFNKFQMKEN